MFPIWIHTKEEVRRLLILGAGGFGHMIQETARLLGYEEVVFLDDAVKGADVIGKCVSAKYCYATHELRLHQNDRCKRFTLV